MRKDSIKGNYILSTFGAGLNILITLISYPIYLRSLGAELYGIWITLSLIVTFSELGNLGLSQTVVKYISENLSENQNDKAQSYYSTGFIVITGIGFLVALFSFFFPEIIANISNVTELDKYKHVIQALGLVSMISIIVSYQMSIYISLKMNYLVSYINMMRNLFKLGAFFFFFAVGIEGVQSMLLATLLATIIIFLGLNVHLKYTTVISPISFKGLSKERLIILQRHAMNILGSKVINLLILPTLKLGLSNFVSFSSVSYLEIAYNSTFSIRSLFERGFLVLIPKSASTKDDGDLKKVIWDTEKFTWPIALICYSIIIIFSKQLLTIWLGSSYNQIILSGFIVFNVGFVISLIGVPYYYVFIGRGQTKKCFRESAIRIVVTYLLTIIISVINRELGLFEVFISIALGFVTSHLYLFYAFRKKSFTY